MEKVKERTRRSWNADDKIGIIRKHLLKVKLVDTCDENDIHPTMFSMVKTGIGSGARSICWNGQEGVAGDRTFVVQA